MKPSWPKRLAVHLALACAVVQLALGSSLAVSAVALQIYASHPHAHSLALQVDGGHVDLILSHDGGESHDHEAAPDGGAHAESVSPGDHVVHVQVGDATNATPRRELLDPAPVLAISTGFRAVVARAPAPRSSQATRAPRVDPLRTVVLRL